ncbi:hypothetical protein [Microbacterium allomyrinae]|uniref:Uncharacterized protein n=1 Tax=Microbacterium allomyrinae TaxID=2830666 RepID=A0A9X1LVW6_9MICO|nr:hypothetical protein [Microbacterium allomyrinae]MCC2032676.1 hypothetical protein [Microbacterium allomyrinae]
MSAPTKVTDQESCAAFDDVSTILQNAHMGLSSGRMSQQEYDGWLRLATRVLDRVPTSGEGAVSDGIAASKAAAPAIPLGTIAPPLIGGDAWNNAAPLAAACTAAGYVFVVESWTGG